MEFAVGIFFLCGLLFAVSVSEPFADKMRLPHSVLLAALGILLSLCGAFLSSGEMLPESFPFFDYLLEMPVSSQLFLYAFLPTLLFQVTLGVDLRRMADDWVPILVMAVVAVVVATVVVGYGLSMVSSVSLAACLLLGAIVSTTDPSAVVGIFRSISAPQRLSNIIEGESLLNDAAAIALFGLFLGVVLAGGEAPAPTSILISFLGLAFGGAVTGWVIAKIAVHLMSLISDYGHAQITMSVTLPYFSYVTAEQLLGVSGVIAVVSAGLTLNVMGSKRLLPSVWSGMRDVWDLLSYWAGALIFILAALFIPRLLEGARWSDFLLILAVVVFALVARALTLFVLLPALSAVGLSPSVSRNYKAAILWGGLRGALTLVLALAVTESPGVPDEVKRFVGILATGFTLFTLMVQGTTLRHIVKKLGLDKLDRLNEALSRQVVAVSLQSVREHISVVTSRYGLSQAIVRQEAKEFGLRLNSAVEEAEDCSVLQDRDRITLGLIALAANEKEVTLELIREGTVSSRVSNQMLVDVERLSEASRMGRSEYSRMARESLSYGPLFRLASFLHRTIGISAPTGVLMMSRFERLIALRLVVRELSLFVDARVRRIHGRRVTELLHALLERRRDQIETALEGLRLQYPGYAEDLERRMIRRVALGYEQRELDSLRREGLIDSELHASLREGIAARRRNMAARPHLDTRVSKEDLMRQIPSLRDLESSELKVLGKAMRTKNLNEGDRVYRRGVGPKGVYFIASGAVELSMAHGAEKLGRGEVFGQIRELASKGAMTGARAITPTTLLVLEASAFEAVLKKNRGLREHLASLMEGVRP